MRKPLVFEWVCASDQDNLIETAGTVWLRRV